MSSFKRNTRTLLGALLLLICTVGWTQISASAVTTKVSKSGKLSVKLSSPKAVCPSNPHWLNEQRGREGCVGEIAVFRGGVEGYFPDFSYNFLAFPRSIDIRERGKGYTLTLAGGDASSSYIAVFTFERDSLKRRRISSAAFPDQAWEDSSFSFNISDR